MTIKKHIILYSSVLSFFIAACTSPAPDNNDMAEEQVEAIDTTAVQQEIDQLRTTFATMVESADYSSMQQIAHPDFMAVGPYGADWDSLRAMGNNGQYPQGTAMVITPAEFKIVGEGWAYEFGNTQTTYLPEGAERPMLLKDTYIMLFRNEGDGWKIYKEVATSTLGH